MTSTPPSSPVDDDRADIDANEPANATCVRFPADYPLLTETEIAALNAAVVEADRVTAATYDRRSAAQAKRAALQLRIDELPSYVAADEDEHTASLADALAADPTHEHDAAAIEAAVERRVEARRAREAAAAQSDLLRLAVQKVDGEVAAIDGEIANLDVARAAQWQAFMTAAHPYLLERFRQQFAEVLADNLEALADLQRIEIDGRRLVPYNAWRIESRSHMRLERSVRYERAGNNTAPIGGSSDEVNNLFEVPHSRVAIHQSTPAIERFRATLSAFPSSAGGQGR